jgi:hypothetical protein
MMGGCVEACCRILDHHRSQINGPANRVRSLFEIGQGVSIDKEEVDTEKELYLFEFGLGLRMLSCLVYGLHIYLDL